MHVKQLFKIGFATLLSITFAQVNVYADNNNSNPNNTSNSQSKSKISDVNQAIDAYADNSNDAKTDKTKDKTSNDNQTDDAKTDALIGDGPGDDKANVLSQKTIKRLKEYNSSLGAYPRLKIYTAKKVPDRKSVV